MATDEMKLKYVRLYADDTPQSKAAMLAATFSASMRAPINLS